MITLLRIGANQDGTFGVLKDGNVPFALTLEKEWINNRPNISCIPNGSYVCRRVNSPRFGETFEVADVQGRTHILFHKGNTEDDSRGCILIGEEFGPLGDKEVAVLSSNRGFKEFMQRLKGQVEFQLIIKRAY